MFMSGRGKMCRPMIFGAWNMLWNVRWFAKWLRLWNVLNANTYYGVFGELDFMKSFHISTLECAFSFKSGCQWHFLHFNLCSCSHSHKYSHTPRDRSDNPFLLKLKRTRQTKFKECENEWGMRMGEKYPNHIMTYSKQCFETWFWNEIAINATT